VTLSQAVASAVVSSALVGAPATALAGPRQSATGTIARVDESAHTLTLTVGHREETFVVSDDTHLRRGPQVVVLNDLSAWGGVRAKVRYVDDGGVRRAESVMVSRDRSTTTPPQDRSTSPPASGMTNPKRSAIR
jgi:hypothetical protein